MLNAQNVVVEFALEQKIDKIKQISDWDKEKWGWSSGIIERARCKEGFPVIGPKETPCKSYARNYVTAKRSIDFWAIVAKIEGKLISCKFDELLLKWQKFITNFQDIFFHSIFTTSVGSTHRTCRRHIFSYKNFETLFFVPSARKLPLHHWLLYYRYSIFDFIRFVTMYSNFTRFLV